MAAVSGPRRIRQTFKLAEIELRAILRVTHLHQPGICVFTKEMSHEERIAIGAWIGGGVQILKGVTLGVGSIVGANSVVTHDAPPYCVAAGSPPKWSSEPTLARHQAWQELFIRLLPRKLVAQSPMQSVLVGDHFRATNTNYITPGPPCAPPPANRPKSLDRRPVWD
jgi:hypothetical protein